MRSGGAARWRPAPPAAPVRRARSERVGQEEADHLAAGVRDRAGRCRIPPGCRPTRHGRPRAAASAPGSGGRRVAADRPGVGHAARARVPADRLGEARGRPWPGRPPDRRWRDARCGRRRRGTRWWAPACRFARRPGLPLHRREGATACRGPLRRPARNGPRRRRTGPDRSPPGSPPRRRRPRARPRRPGPDRPRTPPIDRAGDAGDQRRLPALADLVAGREPVPAPLHVGRLRLRRIGDQEGLLLGQGVHPRAGGEIVGVLACSRAASRPAAGPDRV